MSTTLTDIFDAIVARLEANWNQTTYPLHWPLTEHHPDITKVWIQPRIKFGGAEQVSMGQTGHNRVTGDLVVTINAPVGGGQRPILVAADLIRTLFSRGTLVAAATSGKITFATPSPESGGEDQDWGADVVRCPFWLDES